MKELVLDATSWNTSDDVYEAFFKAAGAPAWHGKNLDALNDSIGTGNINAIEPPYRLLIENYDLMGPEAKKMTDKFVHLVNELGQQGCAVEVRVKDSR